MSANAESQTPQQPGSKKGKRNVGIVGLFVVTQYQKPVNPICHGNNNEEQCQQQKDDAYVAGNQVQIMAQVSGSVTKVWADNTDYVQKGSSADGFDARWRPAASWLSQTPVGHRSDRG
jgi:membrane fusion protein (multidrug efflux system)